MKRWTIGYDVLASVVCTLEVAGLHAAFDARSWPLTLLAASVWAMTVFIYTAAKVAAPNPPDAIPSEQ